MTTPRNQPLSPSTHASPLVSPTITSPYLTSGPPIAPPPRTSSHNRSYANTESSTGSRVDDRMGSSHHSSERDYVRDDTGQSRRRTQQSPRDSPHQQSSSSSNRARPTPVHSTSATAVGSTGSDLPRENSTIINRVVVDDPATDIAREQARVAESKPGHPTGADITPRTGLSLVGSEGVDDGGRGAPRTRQDHSKSERRKETRFGEYILGQTLGEGEFGKVKMGWKKDSPVEVAIKLIRRETLGSNPQRLPKIYREINILRQLEHPNIVKLHEMVETERHIGIILEYASGGELFDYILHHRYLKDQAARRLFAQLVSGVGYLHKKGIVHRDLKLENLLLDRNKNIIITDFGFANTFDASDELTEEIEYNLSNREFVKKMGLEELRNGVRRGDLMQTSCGSPCYAAPELVVSDSLYTGRKVDVWSCGVILYAMLAGYLPFDDDPANPEGDNINLLYKYIVSTPLTFPEYVTPHARDLLRRILVPDPRKRADLFEVARHSWLSEYAHVVGFITSSASTEADIKNTTIPAEDVNDDTPLLARSASVREPGKPTTTVAPVGGLSQKHGHIDQASQAEASRRNHDAKRRTVQVEYVEPRSQTQRGEVSPPGVETSAPAPQIGTPRTRARAENQGPVDIPPTDGYGASGATRPQPRASSAHRNPQTAARETRYPPRSMSDNRLLDNTPPTSGARPSTGGTISGSRLPSRGNSYGQPAVATVAATNAQGRFSQPQTKGKHYVISAPIQQQDMPHENTYGANNGYQTSSYGHGAQDPAENNGRSHRRSNTASGITEKLFGGLMSGGRPSTDQGRPEKPQKSYPPTSMPGPITIDQPSSRPSMDSSRRSFGFSRKNSDAPSKERSSKRFSLLPASFSMKSFTGAHKEQTPPGTAISTDTRYSNAQPRARAQSRSQPTAIGRVEARSASQSTTGSSIPVLYDHQLDQHRDSPGHTNTRTGAMAPPTSAPAQKSEFPSHSYGGSNLQYPSQTHGDYYHATESEASTPKQAQRPQYPPGFNSYDQTPPPIQQHGRDRPGVLQKPRKFNEAYESEQKHSGSSGAARRVMDLFRRRGKAREDR
ncbi:kinase-like protein [Patellaria atrata CBS 101060]|uniref:non-specific serine/threonine protein kinase n=1 Tax=Patellaria atrata CBS 101060 TaxID=1346257 RepID=A0A9P4SB80_9PEZI|nr:kinase-like protein [Patellaria atrata CBS 101060]